jgi:hypothetical protein
VSGNEPGPPVVVRGMDTHRVEVVVSEDGQEVKRLTIDYFTGQPYEVRIDTPDGTDAKFETTVPTRDL